MLIRDLFKISKYRKKTECPVADKDSQAVDEIKHQLTEHGWWVNSTCKAALLPTLSCVYKMFQVCDTWKPKTMLKTHHQLRIETRAELTPGSAHRNFHNGLHFSIVFWWLIHKWLYLSRAIELNNLGHTCLEMILYWCLETGRLMRDASTHSQTNVLWILC